MPESLDHHEKRALAGVIKFIVEDNGGITETDLEKITRTAEARGFGDFRDVFREIQPSASGSDLDLLLGSVSDRSRKFEILKAAIELAETGGERDPGDAEFLKSIILAGE